MLIRFTFSNFKSFREETTLSLEASKVSDDPRVITTGRHRLLNTIGIYGANASGKTSLFDALKYMDYYVLRSFSFADEDEDDFARPIPFMFNKESADQASSFEIEFTSPDVSDTKTYLYKFTVDSEKVLHEEFSYIAQTARMYRTIFSRGEEISEIDLSGIDKKYRDNIKVSLNKKTLIASLGAKLKVEQCRMIVDWFDRNRIINFGDPAENLFYSKVLPKNFTDDTSVQQDVINYLSSFDNGITGFNIEQLQDDDVNSKGQKHFTIRSVHNICNSEETVVIPFEEESAGTLKMFSLYPHLNSVLQSGGVLFIDELNARLHPLLGEAIINLFKEESLNPNHAQLIFSSHDIWPMTDRCLRRDEIWFTEKNSNQESRLFRLTSRNKEKINSAAKATAFAKKYMAGEYGAIPQVKTYDILNHRMVDE